MFFVTSASWIANGKHDSHVCLLLVKLVSCDMSERLLVVRMTRYKMPKDHLRGIKGALESKLLGALAETIVEEEFGRETNHMEPNSCRTTSWVRLMCTLSAVRPG